MALSRLVDEGLQFLGTFAEFVSVLYDPWCSCWGDRSSSPEESGTLLHQQQPILSESNDGVTRDNQVAAFASGDPRPATVLFEVEDEDQQAENQEAFKIQIEKDNTKATLLVESQSQNVHDFHGNPDENANGEGYNVDDDLDFGDDNINDENGFVVSYKRVTYGDSRVVFVKEELVRNNDQAMVSGMNLSATASGNQDFEREPLATSTTKVTSVFYPSKPGDDLTPLTVKLLNIPSAQLGDMLSLSDLAILARTSRYFRSYCKRMMLKKGNLVDEPFVFGKTLRHCPSITHLQWTSASSRFVTDAILSHALRYNLTSLVLSNLDSITNSAFEWMLFEKRQVRLRRLELRNLRLIGGGESLSWVSSLDLERLVVERCPRITEEVVRLLFGPSLRVLHLKSFQFLSIEGTIDALVKTSRGTLRQLDLSSSKLELGFVAALHRLPLLEVLDANYTRVDDDDLGLWTSSLHWANKSLRRLTLNGCENITNESLRCIPLTVEYMNLSQTVITDEGIFDYLNRFDSHESPPLKQLFLGGCSLLTDDSLKQIVTQCSNLRELGCSYCGNLTDEFMDSFPLDSPLQRLSVVGCQRVTVEGMIRFMFKCRSLECLRCTVLITCSFEDQLKGLQLPGRTIKRVKTTISDYKDEFKSLEIFLLDQR